MAWSVCSVDSLTGGDKELLAASDFRWDRALSAGAKGTCVLPLDALGYSISEIRELTAHWARTIVLEWDGEVVFAGFVTAQDFEDRKLELQLTDLWGLWARRGAWSHEAEHIEEWSVTYTDASLSLLAKRAVQRGMTGFPLPDTDPEMSLPITLPSDLAGDIDRTYYGYNLEFVIDVLDDLMTEGLDIDFRPRWVSGALDWHMICDPTPTLREWHVNAPDGGVSGFRELSDGARMTNNSYFIGEGSGTAMLARSHRNKTSTLPLLERMDARKRVKVGTQLSAMAVKTIEQYTDATSSYSFDVLAGGDPSVGDLRLGDTARLWFAGDTWVTGGSDDRRLVRMQGGMGERVKLFCQPTGGA